MSKITMSDARFAAAATLIESTGEDISDAMESFMDYFNTSGATVNFTPGDTPQFIVEFPTGTVIEPDEDEDE